MLGIFIKYSAVCCIIMTITMNEYEMWKLRIQIRFESIVNKNDSNSQHRKQNTHQEN